jgi:ATP-binding cassette subfamily C protein
MTTPGYDLILRDVTFAYGPHSDPVLRNLNLTVPAGDHLAIVGPSGIGKSTLASLLCGLRQPTSGTVQAGDVVAADLPPERLAEIRTLIPQEAYVFAATVWDNLTYLCPTATARQVDNAVSALGAEVMISKLGGVSAEFAPAELSAGERQLIALVRSYISPAPVVVLDEATCHLDPVAERRVEEAFAARRGTLIVIAHRVSSALRARRILVLDGTTAAVGDHETLLATSSLYRELLGHWQVGAAESGPDRVPDRVPARRLSSSPSIVVESMPFDPLPVEEPVGATVGAVVSSNGSSAAPANEWRGGVVVMGQSRSRRCRTWKAWRWLPHLNP